MPHDAMAAMLDMLVAVQHDLPALIEALEAIVPPR